MGEEDVMGLDSHRGCPQLLVSLGDRDPGSPPWLPNLAKNNLPSDVTLRWFHRLSM